MRFGVLGPLLVQSDSGTAVAIGSPSQRLVLAVLLAHEGRSVSGEVLIDALWGDDPPPTAQQGLRTYVSRLRHVVGDRLTGHGGAYALDVTGDEFDAEMFERLLATSATLDAKASVAALQQALDLWRGDVFCDVAETDALEGAIRRLDELRRGALESRARASLAAGDVANAVAWAEELVTAEPLREGAWAVLINGLVAAQRPADALRAYQRAGATLADAGLVPSAMLRAAEHAALEGADGGGGVAGDMVAGARVEAGDAFPASIIGPGVTLIGRDEDELEVHRLLDCARLVTLHGPGGVGKTSLARQVGAQRAEQHRLGVRLVELASLTDPGSVRAAVADALGLTIDAGSFRAALQRAHALDALVVLDNCEHVLDAVAEVVELLLAVPGPVRVLATSRERIGVPGEYSLSVGPLPTDGPDSAAVRLFVDRARVHAPELTVNGRSLEVMNAIVTTLDGLPLAIEMAAARLRGLGLDDLNALLADRLDVLRSARRRGDPRHRTLDAVIEWSEQLLDDDERLTLRQLAVFAGDVGARDIEVVIGQRAMPTVADLVERSLVVANHVPGHTTYGLLGMVRRRGLDQLVATAGLDALASRHVNHFNDVVRRADMDLRTETEAAASRRLDGAFDELRLAHEWARNHDPALAMSLSAGLHVYAVTRQREEAQRWAVNTVPLLDNSANAAVVLATVAYRANDLGLFAEAEAAVERALDIAGDDPVARFAYDAYVDAALYRGDLETARARSRAFLRAAERGGDSYMSALALSGGALAHAYSGDLDGGLRVLEGADSTAMGPSARGWLAYSLGEVLLDAEVASAQKALLEAIELADGVDHRFLAGVARVSLASLLGRRGEPEDALRAFAGIVAHWRARGDRTHQVTTLRNLVVLFERVGAHVAAAELVGSLSAAQAAPSFGDEAARLDEVDTALVRVLGGRYQQHRDVGARRDVPAAADTALEAIATLID